MTKTIEFEDLKDIYDDDTIQDIIEHWQSSIFVHPLTCSEHSDVSLKYEKGVLYCPEENCFYHQHWIPYIVLKYWLYGD